MSGAAVSLHLAGSGAAVKDLLRRLEEGGVALRVWAKDPTLWCREDIGELVDRLGWLHLPARMDFELDRLRAFAADTRERGVERVVLLGMGGSSLAPEVFQRTFGNAEGFPELVVLDSTHPDAVRTVAESLALECTLFVVSSKSGTTLETLSLFRAFWQRCSEASDRPGERFVAITDPGSALERLARERDFVEIFGAPPDVGGRYSALSTFGLVPAALIGVDLEAVAGHAAAMARHCAKPEDNPGLELGAVLGELARAGRDKLTFVASPTLAAFPDWLEQLIAESTGKDGQGILPVVGEPLAGPEVYGPDRVFVALALARERDASLEDGLDRLSEAGHPVIRVTLEDPHALGGELFRWEFAVAVASAVLGIHPFNQPDVQLAKELARQAMTVPAGADEPGAETIAAADAAEPLRPFLQAATEGDYLAIQAFLAPTAALSGRLAGLQAALRDRLRIATTVGYGPRFLHSTGQLHKGGPGTGLYLQLVDRPATAMAVPETDSSFERLIAAQARGDAAALRQRQRRVLVVDLGDDPEAGVDRLVAAVD